MSFTPNIPAVGQSLGSSRPQILNNFSVIRSTIFQDHYGLNQPVVGAVAPGKHKFVHIPVLPAAPTTIDGEACLFTKTSTTKSRLYMIRDNIAGTETQLTTSAILAPTNATNGISWLPGDSTNGAMIIQWGQDTTGTSPTPITFNTPFTGNPFTVVCTVKENSGNRRFIKVTTFSNTDFTVFASDNNGSGVAVNFSWIAIGNKT